MTSSMTSKRSSRVFSDEGHHLGDAQQKQKHHATTTTTTSKSTTYRSRRNSRSSGREDSVPLSDHEEDEPKDRTGKEALAVKLSQTNAATTANKESSGFLVQANTAQTKELPQLAPAISSETQSSVVSPNERPHNFGVVIPGVYRSGYPKSEHFQFILGLKLKTLVTLVKRDDIDHELQDFVRSNGIHQIIFNMKGTKKEAIPPATMRSILQVVIDPRNYPLMIHCNHGKHRTGCVAAAIRRVQGWSAKDAVDEYVTYAQPKIRDCDVDYIRDFQPSETIERTATRFSPAQYRTFCRAIIFSGIVTLIWICSSNEMMAARSQGAQPSPQ